MTPDLIARLEALRYWVQSVAPAEQNVGLLTERWTHIRTIEATIQYLAESQSIIRGLSEIPAKERELTILECAAVCHQLGMSGVEIPRTNGNRRGAVWHDCETDILKLLEPKP